MSTVNFRIKQLIELAEQAFHTAQANFEVSAFRSHFVKSGLIEAEYSNIYGETLVIREDADYAILDIFILVKSPDYTLKHAILWLAAEISLKYDVLLSPRVMPLTAWEQMAQGNTLFYRTVYADGVPLLV